MPRFKKGFFCGNSTTYRTSDRTVRLTRLNLTSTHSATPSGVKSKEASKQKKNERKTNAKQTNKQRTKNHTSRNILDLKKKAQRARDYSFSQSNGYILSFIEWVSASPCQIKRFILQLKYLGPICMSS